MPVADLDLGTIHPAQATWALQALREAGLDGRMDKGRLLVSRDDTVDAAWEHVQRLMECHGLIREYADPNKIKPYKPLQEHVLLAGAYAAVTSGSTGDEFVARLLHEFVWGQGLPNGNHRSATLLANEMLFAAGTHDATDEQVATCGQAFWAASKPLIKEKEFTPGFGESLRPAHLAAAQAYVACLNQASGRSSPPDV